MTVIIDFLCPNTEVKTIMKSICTISISEGFDLVLSVKLQAPNLEMNLKSNLVFI
jgi:hypothetical protein